MPARLALATLAGLAALAAAGPVFADAVAYKGTLGGAAIGVELSAPAGTGEKIVGRYFYANKSIDIPLDAVESHNGHTDLAEEKPCTDDTCTASGDGTPAPVGAQWHLDASADGKTLTGTWTANGKMLPLKLTRMGTRKLSDGFDGTPGDLAAIVDDIAGQTTPLTATSSPYDYLRMQTPPTEGPTTTWGDTAFKYVTNPHTRFAYPRIVAAGSTDIAAANGYLQQRHWQADIAALSCASMAYQGLGWSETTTESADDLGSWPDEKLEVTYLSPTVMSFDESGSIYCGGAHPDNHDDPVNVDVRLGKELNPSVIFNGWIPTPLYDGTPSDLKSAQADPDNYSWAADDALVDFVVKHLPPDEVATDEDSCASRDSIQQSLAISFVQGDKVRFGLTAMPAVASACNGKLVDVPLSEAKALLTPGAADYFPSLKNSSP